MINIDWLFIKHSLTVTHLNVDITQVFKNLTNVKILTNLQIQHNPYQNPICLFLQNLTS